MAVWLLIAAAIVFLVVYTMRFGGKVQCKNCGFYVPRREDFCPNCGCSSSIRV